MTALVTMARRQLTLALLAAWVNIILAGDSVPVLMWGHGVAARDFPARPLARVSSEEFAATLKRHADAARFTVLFVEETLSVEDLSPAAFPHTHKRKHIGYVPNVDEPLSGVDEVFSPDAVDRVSMTDEGLFADIPPRPGKALYIALEDARTGEDRSRMLARHDRFMRDMYDKLEAKYGRVLAVYTARFPSWNIRDEESARTRRQLLQSTPAPDDLSGFFNGSDKAYLYAPTIFLYEDKQMRNLSNGEASLFNSSANAVDMDLKFDGVELRITYTNDRNYWSLSKVTVTQTGKEPAELTTANDVGAPVGFSYHCGQTVNYTRFNASDSDLVVRFDEIQTQPFFYMNSNQRFDSAYDCVGVMTVPIWSGIFLLAIVLIILSGGIMMMMDIRTMDRFDDPKGKTITINASE